MPRRTIPLILLTILSIFPAAAAELTFKLSPSLAAPFLSAKTGDADRFSTMGGGAWLDTGVNAADFINIGPTFGALILPKNSYNDLRSGEDAFLTLVPVGLHLGGLFYPASRIELEVGVAAGAYAGITDGKYHYGPWYRAFGDVAFRFSPSLTVGLEAGWFDFQHDTYWGNPGAAGAYAGVSVRYKLDTEKIAGRVDGTLAQEEPIFSLLYPLYKTEPIGTITIRNNETAEIRNVRVSFRATEGYTSSEIECGTADSIRKRHTEEFPLVADFGQKILQFTEEGKIPGEVVVTYELLGEERTSVVDVTVPVFNRNQIRWGDPSIIASFVASSAPEVLELSKYLVGVARSHLRTGLNRNMQFAMYLFEGIRLAGVKCETDKSTPYRTTHADENALDYVQYPFQTLLYRTGDRDDVAVLMMALLESVGIGAAFVPLDDDVLVLFNTKIAIEKAGNFFDGDNRYLPVDGEAWIPLSAARLKEGFTNSWYAAVDELNAAMDEGGLQLYPLVDAWQNYPPAAFTSGVETNARPDEAPLIKAAEESLSRYVSREFGPQINKYRKQLRDEGESVQLLNRLALLYVRAGMYSAALPLYEKSAEMGSAAAMVNIGNIASLRKDYEEARMWYEKALAADPENASAKKNLNRVLGELE